MLDDAVLSVAVSIFNQKGVKFTMDEVAKQLGISKRTLYQIVPNKEALVSAVVDTAFDAIKKAEKQVLADTQLTDLEKLRKLLLILPTNLQTVDYTKVYQLKAFYPAIYEEMAYRLATDWGPTIQLMERCMDAQTIKRVDTKLFKAIVTGTLQNVLTSKMLETTEKTYQAILDELIAILFEGICLS